MGCAFSRGRRIEKNDAPSFTEYVNVGKGLDFEPKNPDLNSFFGKAGVVSLEKAVEVLDTLGSTMSSLNPTSRFTHGIGSRGNKISILAFEVANTIAKGSKLMHSLSKDEVLFLKKEILPSQGVQCLVSNDTVKLLRIVASDKREEFHIFSAEIARFGDLCKDPQWHNLPRYFQKLDSDPTPQEELREDAEETMQQLITLAQHTSELYHELHALDRLQHDYMKMQKEEESLPIPRRGDGLMTLGSELKHQKKIVKNLKKKSLWCKDLEEIVGMLVEVVVFLHKEITQALGLPDMNSVDKAPACSMQTLGVCGLALHYANIIHRIENIVSRPVSMPSNTRDMLYNGLPMAVKTALRTRLQSFHTELTVSRIKVEMQKILQWMSPLAENTIKLHQGFGWVGEWANMGTEVNKSPSQHDVLRILTLYHADKEKTDEYILQLVVWLHHLVIQVKDRGFDPNSPKSVNSQMHKKLLLSPKSNGDAGLVQNSKPARFSEEDRKALDHTGYKTILWGRSKSHNGYQTVKVGPNSEMLHRSWSHNSSQELHFSPVWKVSPPLAGLPVVPSSGVSLYMYS